MNLRVTVALSVVGTALVLVALLAGEQWGVGQRPDGGPRWPNLIEDGHDRSIYQVRGSWLPRGLAPYLGVHSEYPELATWLFALPYLFFEHQVPRDRDQTRAELLADAGPYGDLHHVFMAPSFLALVLLTALLLQRFGGSPGWALLLFLPACVYFSFSRFDAWPAAFVAAALLAQFRGQLVLAACLLALGAMLKWYPILLLPLFLSHGLFGVTAARAATQAGRAQAAAPSWASRIGRAVLVPGLAAAAVCLSILSVTFFWNGGGLEAVLHPYGHHGGRPPNGASLVFALTEPTRWGLVAQSQIPTVETIGTALQFLPSLLLALFPVRRRETLVAGCLVVVTGFAIFGKVFSPQWVVWVAPLAILLGARRPGGLVLAAVLGVLVWVQMPLFFYASLSDMADAGLAAGRWRANDARIAGFLLLWAWALWHFVRALRSQVPARRPTVGLAETSAPPVGPS